MQKKKNIVFFAFLKVYGWRKSPKTKKTQSKHTTKNQKIKTLKRLFGLASKHVFLVFILFFWLWNAKAEKTLCFFCFFEGLWLEKITKKQKHTKQTQNQKPKNQNFEETFWFSLKKCFFYFHFVFLALKCKSRKTLCFFVFWRFMVGENHQTPKKKVFFFAFQNQKKTRKTKNIFCD